MKGTLYCSNENCLFTEEIDTEELVDRLDEDCPLCGTQLFTEREKVYMERIIEDPLYVLSLPETELSMDDDGKLNAHFDSNSLNEEV